MSGLIGRGAVPVMLALALGGCASFSADGGFDTVRHEASRHLDQEVAWQRDAAARTAARDEVARLQQQPLSVQSATRIALLNNPQLQAEYARLGFGEASLVKAGRLPNPGFSYSRVSGGGGLEIEQGFHFNLLSLLTMPNRVAIESRRFEVAKLAAAAATVEVGMDARDAFIEAVWSKQQVGYFRQVLEAADASHQLMTRMRAVGNASQLALDRERLFQAEAQAALAQAVKREGAAREALVRALGLWGDQLGFRLPERLPELPAAPRQVASIERQAIEQRLDVRRARHDIDAMAAYLGLSRSTRLVNVLEVGAAQLRERGEERRDGYEIALEIPLFDFGETRVAMAEARYAEAAATLRAMAVTARSEVREAYLDYRASYDLARHYRDEIVPLRRRISDQQLLRYNGMLISVFELLADARDQVASVSGYLDALRGFWLADGALSRAMVVGGRGGGGSGSAALPVSAAGDAH